jgi:hypothetical protein
VNLWFTREMTYAIDLHLKRLRAFVLVTGHRPALVRSYVRCTVMLMYVLSSSCCLFFPRVFTVSAMVTVGGSS